MYKNSHKKPYATHQVQLPTDVYVGLNCKMAIYQIRLPGETEVNQMY